MDSIICETQRLLLRKFKDQDLEAVLEIRGDPEVMHFSVRGPETASEAQKFIDSSKRRYRQDGVAQWAVVLKQTGHVIGECGICVQTIEGQKEYEIGYRIHRDYWGQGYASEAAIACREHGLKTLKLPRLISIIEKENLASVAVAKKVGMSLEKQATFYEIPVEIYSLSL